MKIPKFLQSASIAAGLLVMLPMSSQAALMIEIDDLAGNIHQVVDNGAFDQAPQTGIVSDVYVPGSAIFSTTAISGAPNDFFLSDIQFNFQLTPGDWEIRVSDDTYLSNGSIQTFETLVTPSVLENATLSVRTLVNGVEVYSSSPQAVGAFTGMASLDIPVGNFTIEHIFSISSGFAGVVTLDTTTRAVPEPQVVGLLGLALMGLAFVRRKYQAV